MENRNMANELKASRENYRKIIRALIAKGVQDLKNGAIPINGVQDLERLIRLDIELQKGGFLL